MRPFTAFFFSVLVVGYLLSDAQPAFTQDEEVTASDVVDRESLKAFVLKAKAIIEPLASTDEVLAAYESFRTDPMWIQGPVYIFIGNVNGIVVFHAVNPDLEGQDLTDLEDANGVKITQQHIAAAATGGGFSEYLWDNHGNLENAIFKVSYIAPLSVLGQEGFFIGAGINPPVGGAATSVAGSTWGEVKSALQ